MKAWSSLDYKKAQKITGAILFLSVIILFLTAAPIHRWVSGQPPPPPTPGPLPTVTGPSPIPTFSSSPITASPQESPRSNLVFVLSIVSFLTSLTSFLGFMSATALAWKKERREAEGTRLDNEQKELENEKLRRELESFKNIGRTPKQSRKRNKQPPK